MENYITLFIAIAIVIAVVFLQVKNFLKTKNLISSLKIFFPDIKELVLKETAITPNILNNKNKLGYFLDNIPSPHIMSEEDLEDYTDLTLLELPNKSVNKNFSQIVTRTNEYLCKNAGVSADFSILKEICEHQVEILENEIHSRLNAPLYLGLAGTFIGIITGLFGVDIAGILSNNAGMISLQHLINGVVAAMMASLLGLSFTIYNTSYFGKILKDTDYKKEEYYNFLRRELMPVLSNSMASSLNSLKGVLGHFVDKFGKNLDAYADSADLLNDNLEKQHLVLQEINKMSLTKTATKIAESFVTLKDASESFNVFHSYQTQLNKTIDVVNGVVVNINDILSKFDNFGNALSIVVNNQNKATDLQQSFQEAIETHFPTGSEGREVWRKEFDYLVSDAKSVTENLSEQLTATTQYINNFVSDNQKFFESFDQLQNVITTLVQYTQVQADCYKDLKGEILDLRKDYKNAQIDNIDLNKTLLKAVEKMTESIKYLKDRENGNKK